MRRRTVAAVIAASAVTLSLLPAMADPSAQRDMVAILSQAHQRYIPKAAGTQEKLTYVFGPYVVPPGWDANRITLDLPLTTGFIVAVAPDLVDATSGRIPTEQEIHIHHAHWLRITTDPNHEYYATGLSWVFGTGEEKSQGRLDDRSNVSLDEPTYGIPIDGTTPQTLIYMLHNKTPSPMEMYVVLDVDFIHGTRDQVVAATGRDIHPLTGTLWGQTRDATKDYPELRATYVATADGTAVAAGSHLHPGGKYTVVTNLGPDLDPAPGVQQPACAAADPDGDGWPGVTLLKSRKIDRVEGATPYSEDYQQGVTKFGWRAPIHKGDVLRQYAPYAIFPPGDPRDPTGLYSSVDGLPHASFEAMTYTGIYVDRLAPPAALPADPAAMCTLDNFAPRMIGPDTFEAQSYSRNFPPRDAFGRMPASVQALADRYETGVTAGMINHIWVGQPDPLCGLSTGNPSFDAPCTTRAISIGDYVDTDRVTISAFAYLPGDLNLGTEAMVPRVKAGTSLTFYNTDAALNIRHSITSCPAPCTGRYVSNYPLPDGRFDSGKIGNFDPIDGGLVGDDTRPIWETPKDLATGLYTYYCRIHPFMRGAFEVV